VGDLEDLDVQEAWTRDLRRALDTYRLDPGLLAVDMHPTYHSRRLATDLVPRAELVEVQHHHAHLAATMAEAGLGPDDRAVGLIMDGTGWGADGTIWGGEVLVGGMGGYRRAAHLLPMPMPGGEAAAREPVRMAEALLMVCGLPPRDRKLRRVAESKRLSPMTSSAGRLLDGISFLLGACGAAMTYEAEAAMLLESLADPEEDGAYSWIIDDGVVDLRPAVAEMLEDTALPATRAARFHNTLADAMAAATLREARAGGLPVALGGGCFANALLMRRVLSRLGESGVPALVGDDLPAGDGAVAAGQAAVAAACRTRRGQR
jgi:hydrogenase maturation protein HypF